MIEKRDAFRYVLIGAIAVVLVSILLVLRGGPTGYAIFGDDEETEFDLGSYSNVEWNGSALVLSSGQISGTYTSQIFDANGEGVWNNISWVSNDIESSNFYLTSAMHLGDNRTEVFIKDETYYLADMKDSSKNFYLNFSENLIDNSILKIYAKKDNGVTLGVYAQSDINGDTALGFFTVDSIIGAWYNITLDISTPTNAIWIGEGTGSGIDPKDKFDYIFAEIVGTSLDIQIKSCDDSECSGESWTDISDTSPQDLSVDNNQYFQYKIDFTSPDSSISSSLTSVNIDYDLVNTAPSLNLVAPSEGDSYGYNTSIALDFSVSDADDNIDSCWYTIDSGVTNITLVDCANITFDIAEGSYTLNIYVNDSFGLGAFDSASFSVAVGSPSIVLDSPIDVYFSSGLNIDFDYTPTDVDLDSCWLLGDFTGVYMINQTDTSVTSGVINTFTLDLGDGEYLWNIGCNDSVGNTAVNGNKSFYVDGVNPVVSVSEPSGAKTSRTGIVFDFSVTDVSPLICYYNITTSVGTDVFNNIEITDCLDTSFDVSADGDYIVYLWAIDSAGNSDSENSSFSVDSSTPTSPPSGGGSGGGGSSGGGSFIMPNQTGKMTVSQIGDIIAYAGDNKNLSINVKNTGRVFLNKCKLGINGDLSNWIYANVLEGISPGENLDFIFNINVPDEITPGDYSGELEVKCDEGNNIQEIIVSIPGFDAVEIGEIIKEGKILTINYNFDNSKFIGESIVIDIWIVDELGEEVQRIQDEFEINTDALIERVVEIDVDDLSGTYEVYFALSSNLDESVKHSIILGKTGLTGFAIFDVTRNKIAVYAVFLVLLGVFVFFIWRRHGKKDKSHPGHKKFKHSKHHWLLRKSKKKINKKIKNKKKK